ncbi:MAG: outer membrane protein transport protein [Bacteroidales bacterium]|nr:outer membrane protein transport protein [Bacteroidales bacterium]
MRKLKVTGKGLFLVLTILISGKAGAQTTDALGTYTPYSIFGVGDISRPGTAYNKSMGGLGVGVKDPRYINYINPASIVERDSMSFMADFGMEQKNTYLSGNGAKSAYNSFNMHHVLITLPIYKRSALILGAAPYSNVGYKFAKTETDPEIINEMGNVEYQKYGTGGISQLFAGTAVKLFKKLAVGVEGIYYFGTIDRYSNVVFGSSSVYRQINTGYDYVVGAFTGKLGLQYTQKMSENVNATLGATYTIKSKLTGDMTRYATATTLASTLDTIVFDKSNNTQMSIPSEFAVGFSIRKMDKWMFGADYVMQDWTGTEFTATPGVDFKPGKSSSIKIGAEYTPNMYDVRYYYKRITFRGGLYYDQSYMNVLGNQVNSKGITLGMSLPISRWYNSLGLTLNVGQRGTKSNNLVKENYFMFGINFALHDRSWFLKPKYD